MKLKLLPILKEKVPLRSRPNQERVVTFLLVVKQPFCSFSASSCQIKLQTHVRQHLVVWDNH